jgi:CubicO group peptidase (beta-lactamase class C family)
VRNPADFGTIRLVGKAGTSIQGAVDPAFEAVADAFERNFERHGEVGAAFSVVHQGRVVVDIWGGTRDESTGAPWERDSFVPVASVGKAFTAMCAAVLVDRGELDVDAPVADYWPEFAQAGKEAIPVRWVLSHKSGLAGLDVAPTLEDFAAWDPVVEALARQEPLWEPGTKHSYHMFTFGFLVGEIVRRVTGLRPARFFDEEIAGPRNLSAWIVPPAEQMVNLVRDIPAPRGAPPAGLNLELAAKVLGVGAALLATAQAGRGAEVVRVELPSRGYGNARGLAQFFAGVAGFTAPAIIGPNTRALITTREAEGPDFITPSIDNCWGLGVSLRSPASPLLRSGSAFGHGGAGGSIGFADPEAGVAIGYVVNKLRPGVGAADDPRSQSLVDALYNSL